MSAPQPFGVGPEDLADLTCDALRELGGVEGLAAALRTSLKSGVDLGSVAERTAAFGANRVALAPQLSFAELVARAAADPTLVVLFVSGVLSYALGTNASTPNGADSTAAIEGAAVLGSVAIVTLVTALNDWRRQEQFASLNSMAADTAVRVVRGGYERTTSIFELVVGDILVVEGGDLAPADGVFISASDVRVDESSLTGEVDDCAKCTDGDAAPMLLSGTKVLSGVGRVLVTAVGENSCCGKTTGLIRSDVESRGASTELTAKLERIMASIGAFGLAAGALCATCAAAFYTFDRFVSRGEPWELDDLQMYVRFLTLGITVVVVAVPEGLPLATTLAYSWSARRMLSDMTLVRVLTACETMGRATVVCSDKTGTMTLGDQMEVAGVWTAGGITPPDAAVRELITEAIAINTTASLLAGPTGVHPVGDRTETALLSYALSLGADPMELRDAHQVVAVNTFSPERQRMSTLTRGRLYMKGSPEALLARCTRVAGADGGTHELAEEEKSALVASVVGPWCSKAMRVLGLAYREVHDEGDDGAESEMVLLALLGLVDPLRPEVPGAIERLRHAGVDVKIVTGDNRATAVAVAEAVDLISHEEPPDTLAVLEGDEFRARVLDENGNLRQASLDEIWPRLRVLARASPLDKFLLVSGIMSSSVRGKPEVVAVTGDGTNDAPALKHASVGFAMGTHGTDIARDASDVVLLDDDFSRIVSAVKSGRQVYDSISAFLQFQLTVNFAAVATACGSAVLLGESPLTSVQLLWLNLVMDSLAGLSFASEAPHDDLLDAPPRVADEPLITRKMVWNIGGQALVQIAVVGLLVWWGDEIFGVPDGRGSVLEARDPTTHYTIVFNVFVIAQLFNQLNCRRSGDKQWNVFGGEPNPVFAAVLASEAMLQVLIVQFGGPALSTVPLDLPQWAACVGFAALTFVVGALLRRVPV